MRNFLFLVFFGVFAISAFALTDEQALTVSEIRDLAQAQSRELAEAKKDARNLSSALAKARQEAATVRESLEATQAWGRAQEAEKIKAYEKVSYWQGKHSKALRELWFWRSLALAITGLIVGILGFRVAKRIV
jgi:hypothetical protein